MASQVGNAVAQSITNPQQLAQASTSKPSIIDIALATIRTMEGGCQSTAPTDPCYTRPTSGGSNACGAYQYIGSTWRSKFAGALAAGALPAGTPATDSACGSPSWVQDAVARWDVTTFLNSGQPISKLPLLWYYPVSINWSQSQLDNTTPPGNSISLGAYQRAWLATFARLSANPAGITVNSGGSQQAVLTSNPFVPGNPNQPASTPQQATLTSITDLISPGSVLSGTALGNLLGSVPGLGALKGVSDGVKLVIALFANWQYIAEAIIGFGMVVLGGIIILMDTRTGREATGVATKAAVAAA